MVEVQKPEVFCDSCGARAALCGIGVVEVDKLKVFLRFLRSADEPSAGIVLVDTLSLWRRANSF